MFQVQLDVAAPVINVPYVEEVAVCLETSSTKANVDIETNTTEANADMETNTTETNTDMETITMDTTTGKAAEFYSSIWIYLFALLLAFAELK